MRQVASGFAIGSVSTALFAVPFLMMALNIVPSYADALERLVVGSRIMEPLQVVSVQIEQYRSAVMRPVTDYIGHRLFPRLPEFPRLPQ